MFIYHTVKAKPMKAFELHFPMIQFLINMCMYIFMYYHGKHINVYLLYYCTGAITTTTTNLDFNPELKM